MLLRTFTLVYVLALPAQMLGGQSRQYVNQRWGFCTQSPKGWRFDEGINGAGGRFYLPNSNADSSVTVGALPNPNPKQTLQEIESDDVSQLRASGATNVQAISSSAEQFQGLAALRTRLSYVEDGKQVIYQILRFTSGGNLYAIEFQCSPADAKQCEVAFRHIAESFRVSRCK